MDGSELIPMALRKLEKFRYVFLVLLIGIFLMLIPEKSAPTTTAVVEKEVIEPNLSTQLEMLLSKMEGAGKVKVLLAESAGEEIIYQSNDTSGGNNQRTDTVLTTDAGRNQSGLVRQVISPIYQGAVILAQGADRASVKLEITQAVSSLTGLGYDQITVLKMK